MKPHKCPACDGWGKRLKGNGVGDVASGFEGVNCHACQGTGIVWGPGALFVLSDGGAPHYVTGRPQ